MGDLSANFNRAEFACKCGCGFDTVDAKLIDYVQQIREYFAVPITINRWQAKQPTQKRSSG